MTDMTNLAHFYINGTWVSPSAGARTMPVIDPSTEQAFATVARGAAADAEAAIMAARAAFMDWTATPFSQRLALMQRIRAAYAARQDEIAAAISLEMGAALSFATEAQAWAGIAHIDATIEAAERFVWEEMRGDTMIIREGIGVVGLITPWNWPMNQITCKVMPALAAGCTMILKPSEIAPLSGMIWAEIMAEAGTVASWKPLPPEFNTT